MIVWLTRGFYLAVFSSLAWSAIQSILRGRLEPSSSYREAVGKEPILRSEQPLHFWVVWLFMVLAGLVPLVILLFAVGIMLKDHIG